MKTILVVDDSATSRAIFKASIPADFECVVHEADSMESACAKANEVNPDICVMDYNLPESTGVEISQALIDGGVDAQFILMTANMQNSVVERAKALDFTAFIEKPVNPDKVAAALKELA